MLWEINDMEFLNKLYSASDIVVVPSRSESFSNITVESFASGTPVVAFKVGGIIDIIKHKKNGYLAEKFDVKYLAEGIKWCIEDEKRNKELGENARKHALDNYSEEVVIKKFKEYYSNLVI